MAEKNQSPNPLANGHPKSDEEEATIVTSESKDLTKKKQRIKCAAYVAGFTVFQTAIILLFVLFVMRIKNPKFRIGSGSILDSPKFGTEAIPSFNLKINTQFIIKNTNFGHFKYEAATVVFSYRGARVGEVNVSRGRAGARSSKKVENVVDLSSDGKLGNAGELGRDISQGIVPLSSYAKMEGKILLMKAIKKKKTVEMNCTVEVVISTRELQNIVCK